MTTVTVKVETRFYIECPDCPTEFVVDTYESGSVICGGCEKTLEYNNNNPENAESV